MIKKNKFEFQIIFGKNIIYIFTKKNARWY
jgi:hypothetical protein